MNEAKPIKVKQEKESFREKISDLFEEMWEKIGQHHHGVSGRAVHDATPDTDLSETENVLTYCLELPGMGENDVEVLVDANGLIVRGEKRDEREEQGENYIFKERRFGRFERVFTLPGNVKTDEIKASFDKGVLTVRVPCEATLEGEAKKITISSG